LKGVFIIKVETKILEKNLTGESFQKPFQEDLEPLVESNMIKTSFPSKETG